MVATPPSLTKRRAEALRMEIARAAMKLFVEDGDTLATVDRIAAAAGVAPRTFYRHFEVKEDVVLPLFARSTGRIAAGIREAPRGSDPLDVLVDTYRAQLNEEQLSEHELAFVGLMITNPQYRMRWMQVDGTLQEAIAELLASRPDLRAADPAMGHLAAELIAHAGRRAWEEWFSVGRDRDIATVLRANFTLVLAGLRSVAHPDRLP